MLEIQSHIFFKILYQMDIKYIHVQQLHKNVYLWSKCITSPKILNKREKIEKMMRDEWYMPIQPLYRLKAFSIPFSGLNLCPWEMTYLRICDLRLYIKVEDTTKGFFFFDTIINLVKKACVERWERKRNSGTILLAIC